LIAVQDENGLVALRRIAVGEHILLGGDNMDLALARSAAERLLKDGVKLDAWQLRGLALTCREAKERLLLAIPAAKANRNVAEPILTLPIISMSRLANAVSKDSTDATACLYIRKKPRKSLRKAGRMTGKASALDLSERVQTQLPLSIFGRGAAVVGDSVNASLGLADAERVIVDGFLDACEASARPLKPGRSGLRDMGLDYSADPSITKHLAKFLARENRGSVPPGDKPESLHPTAILFNGGVMKSEFLRAHTFGILNRWIESEGGSAPRELSGADPELAVALGAAYFGRVQHANGLRILGGVPRSYYVGVESPRPAVPGQMPTISALCVVPFGMEEGSAFDVPGAEFGLSVGEPAQFRFFSAAERQDDRIGQRVEIRQDAIRELEPIETTIPATLFDEPGTIVPVRLKSIITTMGTLELWFNAIDEAGAWKLELNVREP
jgi:hypothetical protein